jgi:hypothetical protein
VPRASEVGGLGERRSMVSWLAQLSRALVVRASPRAGQRRRASRRGRRPPPTGAEVRCALSDTRYRGRQAAGGETSFQSKFQV